jgi:oxalate decarboxylase/phosphoglucose isomerase-like protein (cupin superfamily)
MKAVLFACTCVFAAETQVQVDNDAVRVLTAVEEPHQKTALHEHGFSRVMVYLDASDLVVTHENGRIEKQHWKAGDVEWSPAGGRHTSENAGNAPVRIVEIELKKPGPIMPATRARELDPVAIDAKHNVLLFENDQVRVFRSWREPGAQEAMHEHTGAGRVAVLTADLDVRVKSGDGTSETMHQKAGDVLWSGPSKHAATNLGRGKFDMILVEVK